MKKEPGYLEIFITKLVFRLYGKSVYKEFADCIPINGTEQVLDFGCGMGTVAYFTAKKLPLGRLTCLDISKRWLNACRKKLKNCKNVIYMDSDASSLESNVYDVIYCHFVLHDISSSDLEKVIPSLIKALKKGGILMIKEPVNETDKLNEIRILILNNNLTLKKGRITDLPFIGSALENIYIK